MGNRLKPAIESCGSKRRHPLSGTTTIVAFLTASHPKDWEVPKAWIIFSPGNQTGITAARIFH